MTIESIQIIEALRFGLKPFKDVDSFDEISAIYAIAFNGENFPFDFEIEKITKGDIIYIGKTQSGLQKRIVKTHFNDGRTALSTLRRSLGAVLKDHLHLKPTPRSLIDGRIRDYKFILESEKVLTEWMVNNLSISFVPFSRGKRMLKEVESEIIYILNPVLNLNHNSENKSKSIIRELREKCRLIAYSRELSNKSVKK